MTNDGSLVSHRTVLLYTMDVPPELRRWVSENVTDSPRGRMVGVLGMATPVALTVLIWMAVTESPPPLLLDPQPPQANMRAENTPSGRNNQNLRMRASVLDLYGRSELTLAEQILFVNRLHCAVKSIYFVQKLI